MAHSMRPCPACEGEHLLDDDKPSEVCFFCAGPSPFAGIRFSMEVGSEDSRDPRRVQDGTAAFNMGLPGVETDVGTRANGKPALAYRPVAHNELPTARSVRDYAERRGLIPMEKSVKRAIG